MSNQLRIEREVTTVRASIDQMAEMRTGEIFLISPETKRELTFGELQRRVTELAHRLLDLGVSKDEKVSFLLDNRLFTVELVLGARYGGFVPVSLNVGAGRS